jgi:hypothetical protein
MIRFPAPSSGGHSAHSVSLTDGRPAASSCPASSLAQQGQRVSRRLPRSTKDLGPPPLSSPSPQG